jgi:hypothetical protein
MAYAGALHMRQTSAEGEICGQSYNSTYSMLSSGVAQLQICKAARNWLGRASPMMASLWFLRQLDGRRGCGGKGCKMQNAKCKMQK